MCGCSGGAVRGFFDEIRSMSGRYASYWNAFLLLTICKLDPDHSRKTDEDPSVLKIPSFRLENGA